MVDTQAADGDERRSLLCKARHIVVRLGSRDVLKPILYGQFLSLLICGTAVTSNYLVQDYGADIPLTQGLCNYVLLALVYGIIFSQKRDERGDRLFFKAMKDVGWKYFLLAFTDVMANYLVVSAYQYTSLTSVQVLDCFVIPVVMGLSRCVLKTRYKIVHLVGAGIALLGVVCMIIADYILGRSEKGPNPLLGDILVLGSATCYGLSNVGMEYFMKGRPAAHSEVLTMYGIFGTFIGGTLALILERNALIQVQWSIASVGILLGFTFCMFLLYTFMPLVMKLSSAATVNLSVLTADLYALFVGIYLFQYKFSPLYIISFFVIFASLLIYNSKPPETAETSGARNPETANDDTTPPQSKSSQKEMVASSSDSMSSNLLKASSDVPSAV